MIKVIHIFRHAYQMLCNNPTEMKHLCLVPGGLVFLGLAGMMRLPQALEILQEISVYLVLFAQLWLFVNWQRYVFNSESPTSWVPAFHWQAMMKTMLYALLLFAGVIVVISPLVGIIMIGAIGITMPIMLGAIIGLSIAYFRVGSILIPAAIGQTQNIRDIWSGTKGTNAVALGLCFVFMLVDNIVFGVAILVARILPFLDVILIPTAVLGLSLLNFSVLSTFYGHFLQNRPLME